MRFDFHIEIVFAVVIGEFLARLDRALCINKYLLLVIGEFGVAIRLAAMIDIASSILTAFPVYGPLIIEFK